MIGVSVGISVGVISISRGISVGEAVEVDDFLA